MTLAQQEEPLQYDLDKARAWMNENGFPNPDDRLCELLAKYTKELAAHFGEHYRPLFDLAFDMHGRHRGFDNCYDWLDSLLANAKTFDLLARLRKLGWEVAIHNDYRIEGERFTFWLFTHNHSGKFIKGEGKGDLEALSNAMALALERL